MVEIFHEVVVDRLKYKTTKILRMNLREKDKLPS